MALNSIEGDDEDARLLEDEEAARAPRGPIVEGGADVSKVFEAVRSDFEGELIIRGGSVGATVVEKVKMGAELSRLWASNWGVNLWDAGASWSSSAGSVRRGRSDVDPMAAGNAEAIAEALPLLLGEPSSMDEVLESRLLMRLGMLDMLEVGDTV